MHSLHGFTNYGTIFAELHRSMHNSLLPFLSTYSIIFQPIVTISATIPLFAIHSPTHSGTRVRAGRGSGFRLRAAVLQCVTLRSSDS